MATNKHVLSIYLKQNDPRASNFSKFWWQLFNMWATLEQLGYIVKQLFLNLLAQSIHAYLWASSPIWASETSIARTHERGVKPRRAFREARFACPNRRACSQAMLKDPTNRCIPESKFHSPKIQTPVSGICNPRHGIQNPRMSRILHGAKLLFLVCSFVCFKTSPLMFSLCL